MGTARFDEALSSFNQGQLSGEQSELSRDRIGSKVSRQRSLCGPAPSATSMNELVAILQTGRSSPCGRERRPRANFERPLSSTEAGEIFEVAASPCPQRELSACAFGHEGTVAPRELKVSNVIRDLSLDVQVWLAGAI